MISQEATSRQRWCPGPQHAPRWTTALVAAAALLIAGLTPGLHAETILAETFDQPSGWRVVSHGPATIRIDESEGRGKVLAIRGRGGLAFCSRGLPLSQIRGRTLSVRALAHVSEALPGNHPWHALKLHVALATGDALQHVVTRLTAADSWLRPTLLVTVPPDTTRAVLNIGVENAPLAQAQLDNLLITTDAREARPLSLSAAVNRRVDGAPDQPFQWEGIPFVPVSGAEGQPNAVVLGKDKTDAAAEMSPAIDANLLAGSVYILHATVGDTVRHPTPCVIWTARFWGGHEVSLSIFEGRHVGGTHESTDLSDWRVAWRGKNANGHPVTLGVTRWDLVGSDQPLESLRARVYAGSETMILAVTAVWTPPEPITESDAPWLDEEEPF